MIKVSVNSILLMNKQLTKDASKKTLFWPDSPRLQMKMTQNHIYVNIYTISNHQDPNTLQNLLLIMVLIKITFLP